MNIFIISTDDALVGFKSINPDHRMVVLDSEEDISTASSIAHLIVSKRSDVAVFGPDIDEQLALEAADSIRRTYPEIDCVSFRESDDSFLPKAMKHGFRDVVSTEEGLMELQSTIGLLEDSRKLLAEHLSLGPSDLPEKGIITVFSPKGGTGKTTIAVNVATQLAKSHPNDVVLIDLDLFAGEVADLLQLEAVSNVASIANPESVNDPTGMKLSLTTHPSGLLVLPAPASLTEVDRVDPNSLLKMIQGLADAFTYVVIDTAPGSTDAAIAAVKACSHLIAVLSPEVGAIRTMQKHLEAFDALNINAHQRHIVLNKDDPKTGVGSDNAEAVLMMPVSQVISYDRNIPVSGNQGIPFVETTQKGAAVSSLKDLTASVAGVDADAEAAGKSKSWFK